MKTHSACLTSGQLNNALFVATKQRYKQRHSEPELIIFKVGEIAKLRICEEILELLKWLTFDWYFKPFRRKKAPEASGSRRLFQSTAGLSTGVGVGKSDLMADYWGNKQAVSGLQNTLIEHTEAGDQRSTKPSRRRVSKLLATIYWLLVTYSWAVLNLSHSCVMQICMLFSWTLRGVLMSPFGNSGCSLKTNISWLILMCFCLCLCSI